ncbi:hypothetical protein GCM10007989_19120 [Devosia pacifica]|uniref:DUF1468 domain-containing protein n=1 Tax=Devosia pacifica TaxID=1335967 RepID=A0A918S416_9HYPH|nr:tripartite tricarboxylate transporter TctB family protein [Devosia pacifica]GHA23762.1 hypothetical protein GCM10007989_19120 [Devosia pacifica]
MSDDSLSTSPSEEAEAAAASRMIRADLVMAVVLIILGAAILYGSWTMPRLELRRVHPLTVPGLVPGMLSFALIICGAILGGRSVRRPAPGGWHLLGAALLSQQAMRAGTVMVLALIYSLILVGTLPFWLATGLFVFSFVVVFEAWLGVPRKPLVPTLAWAFGLAVVTAAAVTLVFERAFLVRLP